jgi:hypothetical protein
MEDLKDVVIPDENSVVQKQEPKVETVSKAEFEAKEKVFTQAQLDEIVVNRLGKEKLRMLKKLGIEDENQIDPIVEKYKQFETIDQELKQLKLEKEQRLYKDTLMSIDVDPDFLEFVMSKIDKGENLEDFKDNAKIYLEQNPKFKKESFKQVNSGLNLAGREVYPDFESMTTDQYLKWRAKNKL